MTAPLPNLQPMTPGQAIRAARARRKWSQKTLARHVVRVSEDRGLIADPGSCITQISRWENDVVNPLPATREMLAEVFETSVEELFGLPTDSQLPRPLILEARVTPETLALLEDRRSVTVRTEHTFGPYWAIRQLSDDVAMAQDFLKIAPEQHRPTLIHLVARLIELQGWTLQESGHTTEAVAMTDQAKMYAEMSGDPALHAMVTMRLSNTLTANDPQLAGMYAQKAHDLAASETDSRLHAILARQSALTAAHMGDQHAVADHQARADDYVDAAPHKLVGYVDKSYIDSEMAYAHLLLGDAATAMTLLAGHVAQWRNPGQARDHAVARARYLHALCLAGDYTSAHTEYETALAAYAGAPSARARNSLRGVLTTAAITRPGPRHTSIATTIRRHIDMILKEGGIK